MKTYLLVWALVASIFCSAGISKAEDNQALGSPAVVDGKQQDVSSGVSVEESAGQTDVIGITEEPPTAGIDVDKTHSPVPVDDLDLLDDLDGLDDLDREIYGLDGLDQETSIPSASEREDDLDKIDALIERPATLSEDTLAGSSENSGDVLLDPSDAEQMRKLQIDISVHPADVIMFHNGETVEGVIRKTGDEFVAIENETGLHTYSISDIEFIDEITEKERFYLLDKIQALQVYHKKAVEKQLEATKRQLEKEQRAAEEKTVTIDRITGKDESDLYNLTHVRLGEIVKEFSQFSPDYWRYYHRKNDAQKAILQLNRLRRYAHANIVELIDQYLRAFETKIKELNEPEGSRLTESYKDSYKKFFSLAEQRRNVLKGADFN